MIKDYKILSKIYKNCILKMKKFKKLIRNSLKHRESRLMNSFAKIKIWDRNRISIWRTKSISKLLKFKIWDCSWVLNSINNRLSICKLKISKIDNPWKFLNLIPWLTFSRGNSSSLKLNQYVVNSKSIWKRNHKESLNKF